MPASLRATFARNLDRLMREADTNDTKIAAALNVHPVTVQRWRKGAHPITVDDIDRVAKALGVRREALLCVKREAA